MRSLFQKLPVALLALALASCNVVHMMERKADKAFRKSGLQEHTYSTPEGPRHVWASAPTGKPWLMLVHGVTGSCAQYAINVKELAQQAGSTAAAFYMRLNRLRRQLMKCVEPKVQQPDLA